MSRPIASILLAVLVLASTAGIPVYTHICHGRAEQWSSAILPVKKCCSEQTHQAAAPEEGRVSIAALPCCQDQTSVAALDTDIQQHIKSVVLQLGKATPALLALPVFVTSTPQGPVSTAKKGYEAHGPPPLLWGRSLLIYYQVFRL